jgi:hypothetical protein
VPDEPEITDLPDGGQIGSIFAERRPDGRPERPETACAEKLFSRALSKGLAGVSPSVGNISLYQK